MHVLLKRMAHLLFILFYFYSFIYMYIYIYLYIYKKLSPKWKKFQEQQVFFFPILRIV